MEALDYKMLFIRKEQDGLNSKIQDYLTFYKNIISPRETESVWTTIIELRLESSKKIFEELMISNIVDP